MKISTYNLCGQKATLCELHFNEDGEIYEIVIKPDYSSKRKTIKNYQFLDSEVFKEIEKLLKEANKGGIYNGNKNK